MRTLAQCGGALRLTVVPWRWSLVAHCGAVWCPFDFQVSRSSGTRALPALKAEAWNNAKDGLESKLHKRTAEEAIRSAGWPGITSRNGLESHCTEEAALSAEEGGRELRPGRAGVQARC